MGSAMAGWHTYICKDPLDVVIEPEVRAEKGLLEELHRVNVKELSSSLKAQWKSNSDYWAQRQYKQSEFPTKVQSISHRKN